MTTMRHDTPEAGQTLVLNVLALFVLLGFAMLVMDGGSFLLSKRNAQGVADAAALAGARSFPLESAAAADSMARSYVTGENADVGASVADLLATTTGGTCTIEGVTMSLPPMSVCVTVEFHQTGVFQGLFAQDQATIRASSIATASQVQSVADWLPFGIQTDHLDLDNPTQVKITPGDQSDNVGGMVNICVDGSCNGAQIIKQVITGDESPDPVSVGDPINTQTGVVQTITNAFQERLAGNTDSFFDVFGQAPDGSWYVKAPDSPRLALMPIAEDTNGEWPLTANAQMTTVGYVLAYIGRTNGLDSLSICPAGCPATTGNGNSTANPLTVYLTPVAAPLPERFHADLGSYDPDNPSPIVYRMTS